ncbi:hypothetical protein [Spiroplasma endosymbiont of Diplazon laetatorius]|uniref:hypothetical protein n=1 Tax=Spiroplasma endosymbiont of Diplazon laetatorius TaxID=3066322 RepID=UPI0030D14B32
MKKGLFFGVLLWLSTLILSFLGSFLIGGSNFYAFNFPQENSIFNILQIAIVIVISLLFVMGVARMAKSNVKALVILYTLLGVTLAGVNIAFLILLKQAETSFVGIDIMANIIMLPIASATALLSIIPMLKMSSGSQTKVVRQKTTATTNTNEPFKPMVLRENPSEVPEFNPEFTSTPNEETFNMSDKLAQLKEDINNNKFHEESTEEETEDTVSFDKEQENLTSTHVIDWDDETKTQTLEHDDYGQFEPLQGQQEPSEPVMDRVAPVNNIPKLDELPPITEPKDPYKQTIVPRRSAQRAGDFDKPIGNVVKPLYVERVERKTPRVDENYQGKVFLGDSDRIWEAMKKQERRLAPKAPKTDHLVSKSNIVNSLQKEKTQTMEIDIDKILDPVNDQNDEDFTPTIDWDD